MLEFRRQAGKSSTLMILVVLFVIAYALTWVQFMGEGHPKMVQKGNAEKGIPIQAHVIAADLIKETLTMTFVPDIANQAVASGRKLTTDVEVELVTGVSVLKHKFKKEETPIPWVAVVPLEEGDLSEYPFDDYAGDFTFKAKAGDGALSTANIELDKVAHGFKMSAVSEVAGNGD